MDDFATDNYIGTLVDVSSIDTVPITAFIANNDGVCTKSVAEAHFDQMTSDIKLHYFNSGHGYFSTMSSYDYFDLIECELQIPNGPSTCFGCFLRDSGMILASALIAISLFSF